MRMVDAFRSEVKLSAPSPYPATPNNASELNKPLVQVLRTGAFNHPKYGEFEITKATLSEMKANFDAKIRGVDIAFDYFHKSDEEAAGWPTELFLSEDGEELWARVDWTPTAIRKLTEREIRYFSPDFAFAWTDPESGVTYKNVLFGGGLTNRPFVKEMAAIVAAEEKNVSKELETKVVKLSEDHDALMKKHKELMDKHDALSKKCDEMAEKLAEYEEAGPESDEDEPEPDADDVPALKKKLSDSDGRVSSLEKELAEMKAAKQMAEKETAFNVLLSEGKAVAAQKDAYLKGDMNEFIKLSQPTNVLGHGRSGEGAAETNDFETKVLKLAEEKVKADPKLTKLDAITLAHKELRK